MYADVAKEEWPSETGKKPLQGSAETEKPTIKATKKDIKTTRASCRF